METATFRFVLIMNSYSEHPDEEVLERYVLRQTGEQELEALETHILACEACVTRLENLELEITAMRRALQQIESRQEAPVAVSAERGWRRWFAVPTLSWAGAVAAVALGVAFVPQLLQHHPAAADFSLSAYRGMETVVVPENRPLQLTLNANDLPEGAAAVSVVDGNGIQVWHGSGRIENHRISVFIPRIGHAGPHFVRLYLAASSQSQPELLREFAIDVR